jgi:hypothetical protein
VPLTMYPGGWDGWGDDILTISIGLVILLRKSQQGCVMCNPGMSFTSVARTAL